MPATPVAAAADCRRPVVGSGLVQVRYRYRVYPDAAQRGALARAFGCARVVYNDAVRVREEAHAAGREGQRHRGPAAGDHPGEGDPGTGMARRGRIGRAGAGMPGRAPRVPELVRLPRGAAERPQGRAPAAPPQARPPVDPPDPQRVRAARARLYVAKVGDIKVKWSRELPSVPSSVTVIREADGRYYASFVVEREADAAARRATARPGSTWVSLPGRHLGRRWSSRTRVSSARRNGGCVRRSGRCPARRKDRANRARARHRVAVLHRKVRETRLDHAHKTALRAGPRQPSGLRRGHRRRRACPHQDGQVGARRGLVDAAAADRGEGRVPRAVLRARSAGSSRPARSARRAGSRTAPSRSASASGHARRAARSTTGT